MWTRALAIMVALAVAVPAAGALGYAYGVSVAPPSEARTVVINETMVLNGSSPSPSSNATIISVNTNSSVNSFALTLTSPIRGDFCLSEGLVLGPLSFSLCESLFGSSLANDTTSAHLAIENIYTDDLLGVYIPSGGAALITARWWANSTYGPVVGGSTTLFVPAGTTTSSQMVVSAAITGAPRAVGIYANASAPLIVVPTGSLCCDRSLGAASTSWSLLVGYLGTGRALLEIVWAEPTQLALAIQVIEFS